MIIGLYIIISCIESPPHCYDVNFDELELTYDNTGLPVFNWSGNKAAKLDVEFDYSRGDRHQSYIWQLRCVCKDPEGVHWNNGCTTQEDWELLNCLESGITYGDLSAISDGYMTDAPIQSTAIPFADLKELSEDDYPTMKWTIGTVCFDDGIKAKERTQSVDFNWSE